MSSTISGVRIADMPDLGTPTDSSSVVAESGGSGRFNMGSLNSYLGGHFLSLNGGNVIGGTTFASTVGITGNVDLYTTATIHGVASFLAAVGFHTTALSVNDDAAPVLNFSTAAGVSRGFVGWNSGDNAVRLQHSAAATYLAIDNLANLTLNGGTGYAAKIGGGTWATLSDARIKDVQGDYTLGLPEVLQLRPVSFVYKGNDAAPGEVSSHAEVAASGKPFVGLIAQEVETALPGMVAQHAGYVDGVAVNDMRSLDTTELVFALVNAVKTMAARLDALEGAAP